jgi:hypothetical protein
MPSFSDYLENKVLDHLFGKGTLTSPTVYVALSLADPGESGSGLSEPAGGSYARVTTTAANWNAAVAGLTDNAAALVFPTATGNWGTITHAALMDNPTSGNVLLSGELTVHKTVNSGDTLQFDAGAFDVTLD